MTAAIEAETASVIGSTTPRLFTKPAVTGLPGPCGCGCALTEETSYGFKVAWYAEHVLGRPLFPWQRWLVIHAGERDALGRPRFRRVIVTVGRQNGKTDLLVALSLYWLFEEQKPSILGTSKLAIYAKESWDKAYQLAMTAPMLKIRMAEKERDRIRTGAGGEKWWTSAGCQYSIKAANDAGGRSMTNHRVIADELAKQYDSKAYAAAYKSMSAIADAQYWGLTTPDPKGVIYQGFRKVALAAIREGKTSGNLGLFEWSAPPGSDPLDLDALAQANPSMGFLDGLSPEIMLTDAREAIAGGGELLHVFKEETMCLQMDDEDAVIDMEAWRAGTEPGNLAAAKDRVALCIDVSLSQEHATLYGAAVMPDGKVRIAAIREWSGRGAPEQAARELPDLVAKIRPKLFGWLPGGGAASIGSTLAARSTSGRRLSWPPAGVKVEEIRSEVTQVCMGFAGLVASGGLLHAPDKLLDDCVDSAEKKMIGDAWRFGRQNGDCDSLYAAAGAAHLARIIPPSTGKIRVIFPKPR